MSSKSKVGSEASIKVAVETSWGCAAALLAESGNVLELATNDVNAVKAVQAESPLGPDFCFEAGERVTYEKLAVKQLTDAASLDALVLSAQASARRLCDDFNKASCAINALVIACGLTNVGDLTEDAINGHRKLCNVLQQLGMEAASLVELAARIGPTMNRMIVELSTAVEPHARWQRYSSMVTASVAANEAKAAKERVEGMKRKRFGAGASEVKAAEGEANAAMIRALEAASALVVVPQGSTWLEYGGALLEPLMGCTFVVEAKWLLKFAKGEVLPECKGVLPPWQLVPEEAEVSIEGLRASKELKALPIAVLSYPWASRVHPDPTGETLQKLVPLLSAICGKFKTFGIVWDFVSLPQAGFETTDDADILSEHGVLFERALAGINRWYQHTYTYVLVCKMPLPESADNQQPYMGRGWPNAEYALSSIAKNGLNFLDIHRGPTKEGVLFAIYRDKCVERRPAPMSPEHFEKMMRAGVEREAASPGSGIRFSITSDLGTIVLPMYKTGFLQAMGEAAELSYGNIGWTSDEVVQLVEALHFAHEHNRKLPGKINLFNNAVGAHGAQALVELGKSGALAGTAIDLSNNHIPPSITADAFGAQSVDLSFQGPERV